MKERPILFSAPMVRAILAGTKMQTRRTVKPQPEHPHFATRHMLATDDEGADLYLHSATLAKAIRCPYGQPGDRLWVRETFSGARAYELHGYPLKEWGNKLWFWADGNPARGDWTRPRPSIHMPRHLSRILLEVVSVRVERLNAISEADAQAEGPPKNFVSWRDNFCALWQQINGDGSWAANPWVWVVEFKRVQA